jgi:hypothetical protein
MSTPCTSASCAEPKEVSVVIQLKRFAPIRISIGSTGSRSVAGKSSSAARTSSAAASRSMRLTSGLRGPWRRASARMRLTRSAAERGQFTTMERSGVGPR